MKSTITNNSDFLFLYEAIQCNPNGDPDEENKQEWTRTLPQSRD